MARVKKGDRIYVKHDVVMKKIKDLGINVTVLGKLIGVDNSWLSKTLKGEKTIAVAQGERICNVLGLTMQEIIAEPPKTEPEEKPAIAPVQTTPTKVEVKINTAEIEDLLGKIYRTEVGTRNLIQLQIEHFKEETQRIIAELTAIKAVNAEMKAEIGLLHDTAKERLPKRNNY